MALFKIYSGTASEFPEQYPLHPGYAYFFEDSGELVIDTENARIGVKAASLIKNLADGSFEIIDVDDVLIANAEEGLAANALLISGDDNTVKAIPVSAGALYMANDGEVPEFGILPIEQGGTGAASVKDARANLKVYSQDEIDKNSTTSVWERTLENWVEQGDGNYACTITLTGLTCGPENKSVPPIVSWTNNQEEYSKITEAQADADNSTITFYSATKPENAIGIVIIDVK